MACAGCVVEAWVWVKCEFMALGVGQADAGDGGGSGFSGLFVDSCFQGLGEGFAVAGLDGEASALDGGCGQGYDAAAAVEAVGWVDGLPDGVVVAEDLAVHGAVAGAGFAVEDGDEHPVRVGGSGSLHAGFAASHVGALQVGLVDGFEAARAAELDGLGSTVCCDDDLFAPPALGLQRRCEVGGELFEGLALLQGCFQGGADVGEQVQAHGFGDGEGLVVGLVEHVLPMPGDGVALGVQVGDGVGGFEAEDGLQVAGVEGVFGHVSLPGRRC